MRDSKSNVSLITTTLDRLAWKGFFPSERQSVLRLTYVDLG